MACTPAQSIFLSSSVAWIYIFMCAESMCIDGWVRLTCGWLDSSREGSDFSITVLIGTACCEMLTCCLNSPGVPAHTLCLVQCVCMCERERGREIVCESVSNSSKSFVTNNFLSTNVFLISLPMSQATCRISIILTTHTHIYSVTASHTRTAHQQSHLCGQHYVWHFWQVWRFEMTAVTCTHTTHTHQHTHRDLHSLSTFHYIKKAQGPW